MNAGRHTGLPKRVTALASAFAALAVVAVLVAVIFSRTTYAVAASTPHEESASAIHLDLSPVPGGGAPEASGTANIAFDETVMEGSVHVKNVPRQPFGSGRFYGVWFVRTDTGNKAFLGALIHDQSIIFSVGGGGKMEFAATQFTTGPNAGAAITRGPEGANLIIVLIENSINGLTPSPVGAVPGPGAAVAGTF